MGEVEEKMLTAEEAKGVYSIITDYLLFGTGELSHVQRKGIGRLLSEIEFTNENFQKKVKPELYPVR